MLIIAGMILYCSLGLLLLLTLGQPPSWFSVPPVLGFVPVLNGAVNRKIAGLECLTLFVFGRRSQIRLPLRSYVAFCRLYCTSTVRIFEVVTLVAEPVAFLGTVVCPISDKESEECFMCVVLYTSGWILSQNPKKLSEIDQNSHDAARPSIYCLRLYEGRSRARTAQPFRPTGASR